MTAAFIHENGEILQIVFNHTQHYLPKVFASHVDGRFNTSATLYLFCRCPKSDGDESRAPTMCLVCGMMLCSQSYCCQTELETLTVGAATAHAHTCGAGTGMFLR